MKGHEILTVLQEDFLMDGLKIFFVEEKHLSGLLSEKNVDIKIS